jgi:hypothetical protein
MLPARSKPNGVPPDEALFFGERERVSGGGGRRSETKPTLGQLAAMTAMVGPPTYPAPMQQMCKSNPSLIISIVKVVFYCSW